MLEPMPELKPVLVSACLLGKRCRHDARDNEDAVLQRALALRGERAVPYCPEEAGGLGTPRPASWIETRDAGAVLDGDERMVSEHGRDVTAEFLAGARGALELCRAEGIYRAYLKERSPSCGVCQTHVAGAVTDGSGITAELLRRSGIAVEGVEGRRR